MVSILLSLNYILFTTVMLSLWLYSLGAGFLSVENIPKNNSGVPVWVFLEFDPNTYSLKDISRSQEEERWKHMSGKFHLWKIGTASAKSNFSCV